MKGKKFMWDGKIYETESEARNIEKEYGANNFEVMLVPEDGKYLVYTRRVVTEVVVTG
jgi:ABC-type sulfate transport system substrate-binding protein